MKHRTPVQGISTEKSPESKSRKAGSERGAGLPEDLTWAHHDTVHTGTCTHSGTHAAEAVNNWWCCRYLVDAKAPGRKKKFCQQLPNRAGCFCVCVCVYMWECVCAWHELPCEAHRLPLSLCHTTAANESPDMKEVWAHHHLWLVRAATGLRSPAAWLAGTEFRGKKFPFPFLLFLQCSGKRSCVWVGVHTVVCVCARKTRLCWLQ